MSNILVRRLFDAVEDNNWPAAKRCLNFGAPAQSTDHDGETFVEGFIRHSNWAAVLEALDVYPEAFHPDLPPEDREHNILDFMTSFMDDSGVAGGVFIAVAHRFPEMLTEQSRYGTTAVMNLTRYPDCGEVIFDVAD